MALKVIKCQELKKCFRKIEFKKFLSLGVLNAKIGIWFPTEFKTIKLLLNNFNGIMSSILI